MKWIEMLFLLVLLAKQTSITYIEVPQARHEPAPLARAQFGPGLVFLSNRMGSLMMLISARVGKFSAAEVKRA